MSWHTITRRYTFALEEQKQVQALLDFIPDATDFSPELKHWATNRASWHKWREGDEWVLAFPDENLIGFVYDKKSYRYYLRFVDNQIEVRMDCRSAATFGVWNGVLGLFCLANGLWIVLLLFHNLSFLYGRDDAISEVERHLRWFFQTFERQKK